MVHGLAGLSNAQANCWPLVLISGSCEQGEVGKGAFQELDQVAAAGQHAKWAGRAQRAADIPRLLADAFQVGRPPRLGPARCCAEGGNWARRRAGAANSLPGGCVAACRHEPRR
jgi:thiamine pyrophosphate-dependent acetolactate synthase large subunit-like protein